MAKIFDAIEIGLTEPELRQALRAWMGRKTLISEYRVTNIVLQPRSDYVVRFTVEPPLEKADQEKLAEPDAAETVA